MNIFDVESYLTLVVMFVLLAVTIFAFVNSLLYSAESYVAAGKLTKPAWGAITALALVLGYLSPPLSFFWLPAVIGAVVYLVDVRPAVRGRRRGNSW